MNMWPNKEKVERIRKMYPVGSEIILHKMGPDPHPIPPETKGTVYCVDDIGQVHCDFEGGRQLGLIIGEDDFELIKSLDVVSIPMKN